MKLPDFLMALPRLDVPFPIDVVESRAMRTDDALVVFFIFHKDASLPPHSHGPQWGTVLHGEVTITMNSATRTYHPGETYDIGDGVVHAVEVKAGTIAIDAFAEADRYPLKG